MYTLSIIANAALIAVAGVVVGAYHEPSREALQSSAFEQLDLDRDQHISLREAFAEPPLAQVFAYADADHDGLLNRAEYVALPDSASHRPRPHDPT